MKEPSLIWIKRNRPEDYERMKAERRAETRLASEKKRQELIDAAKQAAKESGERLTVAQARQLVKRLGHDKADIQRINAVVKLALLTPRQLEDKLWDAIHFHPDCENFGHQRSTRLAQHIVRVLGL